MEKHSVLLVEDNPDDVALTLRALKKSGVINDVTVAQDGAEALDYLLGAGAGQPLPMVVLLDLKLPKVDGLEVLRRLRSEERTKLIPIVILTSSREEQDIAQGYRLGCNSYVRKPVEFGEFAAAVSQLGLYWLILNQPPQDSGK